MRAQAMFWMRGVGFAASALLAGSVFAADGPRYTYVEIGYQRINPDNFDDDANVGSADGSVAVADHVHLFAGYSYGQLDTQGVTVDLQSAEGGAGLNFPLSKTVDVVADAAYLWSKAEVGNLGSRDDTGYGLRLGLRAMVTPKLELNGGATFTDVSGTEWAGYVGAVYNFTDVVAMTLDVSVGQDSTAYGAGLRFYLGGK